MADDSELTSFKNNEVKPSTEEKYRAAKENLKKLTEEHIRNHAPKLPPTKRGGRRPRNLNLNQKYHVVQMLTTQKKSINHVRKIYQCGRTQIYNILKNRDEICERYTAGDNLDAKKKRITKNERVNRVVFQWFCAARANNMSVTGPLLQETALKTAKLLHHEEFKASTGWLRCFRQRYNITFNVPHEDPEYAERLAMEELRCKLESIDEEYEFSELAARDETAICFKLPPRKTLLMPGEKCSGMKREHVTVLIVP